MIDVGIGEHAIDYAKDFTASVLSIAVLGSFACSCGDTWASEIGTAISSHIPVLITTFSKVPVGTNGGVTITGTISSILGGTTIGVSYYITLVSILAIRRITVIPPQWPIIVIGCLGGFLGSAFDSVLGATLQYSGYCSVKKRVVHKPASTVRHISGRSILDNHGVNFVSCLLTSIVMPIIGYFLWKGMM
ncbi:Transmembrane protein 19 [Desmophyllum pertusum]|uniref:Transmembrane protein 19 n=1 Tax=Desmophyllum pertusum TaxID=174260 RepID=A0A9X0CXF6_9CNID|nr:Transmembrane protein 19 [Desmophyllum pertusum]